MSPSSSSFGSVATRRRRERDFWIFPGDRGDPDGSLRSYVKYPALGLSPCRSPLLQRVAEFQSVDAKTPGRHVDQSPYSPLAEPLRLRFPCALLLLTAEWLSSYKWGTATVVRYGGHYSASRATVGGAQSLTSDKDGFWEFRLQQYPDQLKDDKRSATRSRQERRSLPSRERLPRPLERIARTN